MFLGLQVTLTILGIYVLVTGKSVGKDKVKDWRFRLLGGCLLTLFPLMFLVSLVVGLVYSIMHPDMGIDALKQKLHWTMVAIEVGATLLYTFVAIGWAGGIQRRVHARPAQPIAP